MRWWSKGCVASAGVRDAVVSAGEHFRLPKGIAFGVAGCLRHRLVSLPVGYQRGARGYGKWDEGGFVFEMIHVPPSFALSVTFASRGCRVSRVCLLCS